MDILFSFFVYVIVMVQGAIVYMWINNLITVFKKMKEKALKSDVVKPIQGRHWLNIIFKDGHQQKYSILGPKTFSPFRHKTFRRVYKWFFTKNSPLFTICAYNVNRGNYYFSFRREDIKNILMYWTPEETQ